MTAVPMKSGKIPQNTPPPNSSKLNPLLEIPGLVLPSPKIHLLDVLMRAPCDVFPQKDNILRVTKRDGGK